MEARPQSTSRLSPYAKAALEVVMKRDDVKELEALRVKVQVLRSCVESREELIRMLHEDAGLYHPIKHVFKKSTIFTLSRTSRSSWNTLEALAFQLYLIGSTASFSTPRLMKKEMTAI